MFFLVFSKQQTALLAHDDPAVGADVPLILPSHVLAVVQDRAGRLGDDADAAIVPQRSVGLPARPLAAQMIAVHLAGKYPQRQRSSSDPRSAVACTVESRRLAGLARPYEAVLRREPPLPSRLALASSVQSPPRTFEPLASGQVLIEISVRLPPPERGG